MSKKKQKQPEQPPNPKDIFALKKIDITKFPAVALLHGAHAMMNGAHKYGPYNWRGKRVLASVYVAAAMRHLWTWFDSREEVAEDSKVHHLGHAIACPGIILDAQATGNLIDDRPMGGKTAELLERLSKTYSDWVEEQQKRSKKVRAAEKKNGYSVKTVQRKGGRR